jgi:hypothetical protein
MASVAPWCLRMWCGVCGCVAGLLHPPDASLGTCWHACACVRAVQWTGVDACATRAHTCGWIVNVARTPTIRPSCLHAGLRTCWPAQAVGEPEDACPWRVLQAPSGSREPEDARPWLHAVGGTVRACGACVHECACTAMRLGLHVAAGQPSPCIAPPIPHGAPMHPAPLVAPRPLQQPMHNAYRTAVCLVTRLCPSCRSGTAPARRWRGGPDKPPLRPPLA